MGPDSVCNRTLVRPPAGLPRQAVAVFLGNCRSGLPALQDAIQRLDFEFIRVYGHRMKGCGAPYGFPKLTETGAALEQSARAGNAEELRRYTAALAAYLEAVELEA
jgi:HPt (histidine-containing phosphotransfer) domain-containing protein